MMGDPNSIRRLWFMFAHHIAVRGKAAPLPVHAMHLVRVIDGVAEDLPCCNTIAARATTKSIPGGMVLACGACLVISET